MRILGERGLRFQEDVTGDDTRLLVPSHLVVEDETVVLTVGSFGDNDETRACSMPSVDLSLVAQRASAFSAELVRAGVLVATVGAESAPDAFRLGTAGPAVRRTHAKLRTALPADQATLDYSLRRLLTRLMVGDEERDHSYEYQG